MNQLVTSSMVQVLGRDVTTSSLQVAEFFGKQHKNVLRDIEGIVSTINELNVEDKVNSTGLKSEPSSQGPSFVPSEYLDDSGKINRCYTLDKDAFMLLVMGYSGPVAMSLKLSYINAFNTMETALIKQRVMDAIMGKVSEHTKLGVWMRQGLNQEQWAKLDETMRDISECSESATKAYNATSSHFSRYFKGADIPLEIAEIYLSRVRAAYASGYEPGYCGGKLVIDEDFV